MWSGKKPVPEKGMKIKHAEYEIEKKGQYTNYNIKKLELAGKEELPPEPTPQQSQSNNNRDASFYVSYAKDLQVARIQADPSHFKNIGLDILASNVVEVGLNMMRRVNGNTPINISENAPEKREDAPRIEDNEISVEESLEKPTKDFFKETVVCDGPLAEQFEKEGRKEIAKIFCATSCSKNDKCAMGKQLKKEYIAQEAANEGV